ncbi:response regulator transcription factor [Variovorax guangxiensis]|uniref:response regulator n=1 Tax=Variovorax guangxiensis TaxID=1775474 RepID=UPI00285C8AE5|nr:response regulator transcription factor [Variovorax guangxiensis]MDR6859536.1 DNA-binding NarL/FixJ family response regulator [Variovorax guangxiensis]
MSIYVVDDHPMMRDGTAMMMRRLQPHRKVVELRCLAELVPSADATGPPGLIVLDLNLPDAVGCSGVRRVKRQFSHVPLAVYSASPADDMEADCIEAGADVYIEKTAGASELVAALRSLLFDIPLCSLRLARDQGRRRIASIAEVMGPHGSHPISG